MIYTMQQLMTFLLVSAAFGVIDPRLGFAFMGFGFLTIWISGGLQP